MNKTGMSGWTSEGRGFMPSSNKTYYSGHLCEENAIYSKTIRSKLTEIQLKLWIFTEFGDGSNINTFSVKMYPHKEILYSLERPHSYDSNASLIMPNQQLLTKLCII